MSDAADILRRAETWHRGNHFEDFEVGDIFHHSMGRTITESDAILFSILTLTYNPVYTDIEAARQAGYESMPVNPLLVFNTTFGLSVEDLSEIGGPFLGVDDLDYATTVYPGDTIRAESVVLAKRPTAKHPHYGIVTWRTTGRNQRGEQVVVFQRSNLVSKRP
jgi:itaconyl-CoA hydratase